MANKPNTSSAVGKVGAITVLGAAVGTALGAAMGNVAGGIALGTVLGAAAAVLFEWRRRRHE